MSNVSEHLERWLKAGVIDDVVAGRIRAYEQRDEKPANAPEFERPSILEALVYLGLVVVAVGAIALIGNSWDELQEWSRIAVVGVPSLAMLAVGAAFRSMDQPAMRRGGQAAWLVSVALFAGTLAVAFDQFSDLDDNRNAFIIITTATLLYAVTLWAIEPSYAQVLTVGGATFFMAQAAGSLPDEFSVEVVAVTGVLLSSTALVLGEFNVMQPRPAVRLVFGLIALVTSYMASFETALAWEFFVFAIAAIFIAVGVWRSSFIFLMLGVAGSFIGLVTFMFAHFSKELGAPLALIISGAMLLAAAFITMEARKFIGRSPA